MHTMKLPALAIFLTLILLTFVRCEKQTAATPANPAVAQGMTMPAALPNFTALVKKEGPSVVNISTTQKIKMGRTPFFPTFPDMSPDDPFYEFFHRFAPDVPPHEFRSQSLGSGFIIDRDGYILTNAHVVENADEIVVRLTDKREFKAKIIGLDHRSDIALLKIPASNLPIVNIGDSSKLEVGEWVVAIGSPFGFSNSVSQGIVSAKGRSLPGESIVPFIQTDVPVNPGNSGGPLFNLNGEVVGINSQIYSQNGGYMGLSFAIPIDLAMKVKSELLKHGSVKRGWLGVNIQSVSPDHARSFGLAKVGGALISSVEKDGPADKAGLEIGDIILKFNGNDIAGADDLARAVADAAPGSTARIQVWREGSAKDIVAILGEAETRHATQRQRHKADTDQLGLTLRELSRDERQALHTDGHIVVDAVTGIAEASGIRPGDIIVAVNNKRVSDIGQLRAALDQAGNRAALLVQREDSTLFIPLKPADK